MYESQVLELLKFLDSCGVDILLLQGYKNEKEKSVLLAKIKPYFSFSKVVFFRIYPCYSFFEYASLFSLRTAISSIRLTSDTVFHVRSEALGCLVKKVLVKFSTPVPILVDIRAVILEELRYKKKRSKVLRRILYSIQAKYYESIYGYLFQNNEKVSVSFSSVSYAISEYFEKRYGDCNSSFYVNPNIAGDCFAYSDRDRLEIRQRYGIPEDRIVAICSSAGGASWQKDADLISHLVNLGFFVFNLSAHEISLEGCISRIVPFSEMPKFLSASDVAVLWRDRDFINFSASPSKYSEFALMGLFVIHNGTVDIATKHITQTGAGIIVDETSNLSLLSNIRLSMFNRQEWIEAGRKRFGVASIVASYMDIYACLLKAQKHS